MEWRGREYNSWEQLVEKAIDAEAKSSLQPPSILRKMDQCYSYGSRLAYSTIAKSQIFSIQDSSNNHVKKSLPPLAPKSSNTLPARSNKISDKKASKEKKKYRRLDQQQNQSRKDTSPTPATGANSGIKKDISQIMYFNYNNKKHYSRDCSEPRKDVSKN